MIDITRPWVVDSPLSTRFPVYTRANVGEVAPHIATPLFWSMIGGLPCERQWKRALAAFGAFDEAEFRSDVIDIQGMVHGYVYLNLSALRVFGVRMPGADAELMDRTYLGAPSQEAPYVPTPTTRRPGSPSASCARSARSWRRGRGPTSRRVRGWRPGCAPSGPTSPPSPTPNWWPGNARSWPTPTPGSSAPTCA